MCISRFCLDNKQNISNIKIKDIIKDVRRQLKKTTKYCQITLIYS